MIAAPQQPRGARRAEKGVGHEPCAAGPGVAASHGVPRGVRCVRLACGHLRGACATRMHARTHTRGNFISPMPDRVETSRPNAVRGSTAAACVRACVRGAYGGRAAADRQWHGREHAHTHARRIVHMCKQAVLLTKAATIAVREYEAADAARRDAHARGASDAPQRSRAPRQAHIVCAAWPPSTIQPAAAPARSCAVAARISSPSVPFGMSAHLRPCLQYALVPENVPQPSTGSGLRNAI